MSTRESPDAPIRTGGCQCGQARYEVRGAPLETYVCHCIECRRQSASAFGISVIVRAEDLRLVKGETRIWARPSDLGGHLDCHFCPVCGTRLWHVGSRERERVSVKGGSLDVAPDLSTAMHIWTKSKVPGVVIPPGTVTHPGEPPE